MSRMSKQVSYSQYILIAGLVASMILKPQYFFNYPQGGLSNFGISSTTIIPFSLGFLGCSLLIVIAAQNATKQYARYSYWLYGLAFGYTATLLSTYFYKANPLFKALHFYVSACFIIFAGTMLVWLLRQLVITKQFITYTFMYALGVIIGIMTILKLVDLLFLSELLIICGFAGALIQYSKARH